MSLQPYILTLACGHTYTSYASKLPDFKGTLPDAPRVISWVGQTIDAANCCFGDHTVIEQTIDDTPRTHPALARK